MKQLQTPQGIHILHGRSAVRAAIGALAALFILAGCSAASPGTLPGTSAATDGDTITVEGVILTNGTVYISKAPAKGALTHQLITVQMDQATEYKPGSVVEFVLLSAFRESYPLQASAISSRLISDTSGVLLAPITVGPDVLNHLGDNALFIDVRTSEEFAAGYIAGAINLPVGDIVDLIGDHATSKDQTLLIYCRSGNRSATAAKSLKQMGYSLVFDLGGIIDWPGEVVTP